MPYTLGFIDPVDLAQHFEDHGHEFGVEIEEEYEMLADEFLGGPRDSNTYECVRKRDGARLRYNRVTDEFGVLTASGEILTYFKPDPRIHKRPTNWDYFQSECQKT